MPGFRPAQLGAIHAAAAHFVNRSDPGIITMPTGSGKTAVLVAASFRQDQREIKGRFIFTYDLREAYRDGIFGDIAYEPVTPAEHENHDIAIARAAERQFALDRESGYRHHVMVRTDSRKRADELGKVYQDSTQLRLKVVTGDKSLRYVKQIINQLHEGELDGIICVNMLGEGFNFPSLKIAAVHSPHRSLSVTLQFIGRFARTVGERLGPAKFLAIPSEIRIEAERLYDTRSVWQEVVQNLSATRVHQEAHTREVLESFSAPEILAEDLDDLSLYVLEPYYHVKLYQLSRAVDFHQEIEFPEPLRIVYKTVSEEHNAAVYITREVSLPRWTIDDRLSVVQPDLFIFYQDPITNLLFVCASRRSNGLYEQLMLSFEDADPKPLALVRLNRALNDLEAPEFFNVGMRNRVASSTTESYRIIAGSNADKAILKSDGRLYHRGHVFGRATESGNAVTIGLSSASKIWSNKSSRLPELIAWCATLASRISSDRTPVTGSGLDFLDVGREINELPSNVIGVDWPQSVYKNPPMLRVFRDGSSLFEASILDFDLMIDEGADFESGAAFVIRHSAGCEYRATFSFGTDRFIEAATDHEPQIEIVREREELTLINFLNAELPYFFTADLAMIHGHSMLAPAEGDIPVFDERAIEEVDWTSANVDICREFGVTGSGRVSVHEYLERWLQSSDLPVVYYDHGTGEVADFLVFEHVDEKLLIRLFHCKGATGASAGHRLADVYEITGQAIKSVTWASKQKILSNVRRRFTQNIGCHRFIRGDLMQLTELLESIAPAQISFEFVAVQPGLSKSGLPAELANLLAAASDHLVRGGFLPLRVLASA